MNKDVSALVRSIDGHKNNSVRYSFVDGDNYVVHYDNEGIHKTTVIPIPNEASTKKKGFMKKLFS